MQRLRPIDCVSLGVCWVVLVQVCNSSLPIILSAAGARVLAGWGSPLINVFRARQAGLGYNTRQFTAALSYLLGAVG